MITLFSRQAFFPFNLLLFFLMVVCSSCSPVDFQGNGLDESQFAADPSLRASLNNVVAVHLEHPLGGAMEDDATETGHDLIPYIFDLKSSGEVVNFCFTADAPHVFNLLDSNQNLIQSFEPGSDCTTLTLQPGLYDLKFSNGASEDIEVSILFIRQYFSASSRIILINSDCQNCDLSGIEMQETDLSGHDFSRANFNRSILEEINFLNSNLNNTSFFGADVTGSIFAESDDIFLGEEVVETWVSADGAYTLRFTFNYLQQAQVPAITLTILDSNLQELYSQAFDSEGQLSLDLPYMQGSLGVQGLNLGDSNDDGGIWADLCWGDSFTHCFHGVMLSFDSFDFFSNSLSKTLLSTTAAAASEVQLNLINQSSDTNNPNIVIFQKNVATNFSEVAVAWKVIQNLGIGQSHFFTFPTSYTVGASDSFGNPTSQLPASPGQLFTVSLTVSGNTLSFAGSATSITEMQILNQLPQGAINASIYKDDDLLATKTGVLPGQKASFEFKPTIWIGPAGQVEQGAVIDSAILSSINTEISLLGIASADIIMTGGGSGPSSTPLQFSLANVVMQ